MSLTKALLDRFFRKKEDPEAPEEAERSPVSEPAPPPPPPKPELALPADHPIKDLWREYCASHQQIPSPNLCLEEGPEAKAQLLQLQLLVNTSAKQRLALLHPKADAKGKSPPVPSLNAQVVVFVPRSGLSAWLLVYPPTGGGKELERGDVLRALEREHVTFGVDKSLADTLPQRRDRYFHLFRAAQGEAAQNGVNGEVRELFPRSVERNFAVDEQNRVDYTSLTFFQHVEEGGTICEISLPTKGVPGHTVRNQAIPAKDGRAASVPKGKNTQLSEDGKTLAASISGQVEFNGYAFQVSPLLEVPGNVDFSTGNINFVGDIHIRGDICGGFSVRAMGNITVDGVVESCSVEAGGDLVVVRGVQGDGQAVIRSQRNIFAKYLENCRVYARETLNTDCLINCDVYCGQAVQVRSGRMTIIGGSVRASREVSAGVIGSRMEGRTDIILGGNPCEELDRSLLEQEVQSLKAELESTKRQPDSPKRQTSLSKLRVKLMVAQKKLDELKEEPQEKEAEASPDLGACRMVCDTVYPGTRVFIGGTMAQITDTLTPCRASLADGEICLI